MKQRSRELQLSLKQKHCDSNPPNGRQVSGFAKNLAEQIITNTDSEWTPGVNRDPSQETGQR